MAMITAALRLRLHPEPCCCRRELTARLEKLQSKLLVGASTLQVGMWMQH